MNAVPAGGEATACGLLDALPSAALLIDRDGVVLRVNPACRRLQARVGVDPRAGEDFVALCRRLHASAVADAVEAILSGHAARLELEHAWRGPAGRLWLRTSASELDSVGGVVIVQDDRSALERAEARQRDLELRLRVALDASGQGLWELDLDAMVAHYDHRHAAMLGYDAGELRTEGVEAFRARMHPDDREDFFSAFDDYMAGRTASLQAEFRLRGRDGRYRWIAGEGRVVERDRAGRPVRMLGSHRDVDRLKRSEGGLERSLREKETLLLELHHRVKNNLQLATSVLHFGSRRVTDPAAADVLADCQRRLRAMALVHQQLYASADLTRVGLGSYLRKLVGDLRDSYRSGGRVRVSLDLDDTWLSAEVALPLGMIVCELVTNSLSHAFPGDREGTLQLSARRRQAVLRVVVDDDGIGLPHAVAAGGRHSFGLTLVGELTRQLRGELELGGTLGCCAVVELPLAEGQ